MTSLSILLVTLVQVLYHGDNQIDVRTTVGWYTWTVGFVSHSDLFSCASFAFGLHVFVMFECFDGSFSTSGVIRSLIHGSTLSQIERPIEMM